MCGIWPSWRRREGWTVTPQSTKVRQTGRLSFSGCLCPACLQLCPTCASVFTRCATARRRLMKAWGAPSSRPAPTAPLVHSRAPVIRRPSRTSPTPPAAPVPCSSPCACFCSQAPPVPAVASPPPPLPPAPPQPPQELPPPQQLQRPDRPERSPQERRPGGTRDVPLWGEGILNPWPYVVLVVAVLCAFTTIATSGLKCNPSLQVWRPGAPRLPPPPLCLAAPPPALPPPPLTPLPCPPSPPRPVHRLCVLYSAVDAGHVHRHGRSM